MVILEIMDTGIRRKDHICARTPLTTATGSRRIAGKNQRWITWPFTWFPGLCPPPAFPSSSNIISLPLQGWKKRERPMKTDLYLSQQINQTLWHTLELQELALAWLSADIGSVKRVMLMEAMQEIASRILAWSITFVNYKRTQWLIGSGPGVQ